MVIEMKESVMDRYVECATADMYQNMRMDIRCPCRRCKLVSLFDPISGTVNEHLLRFGFMEGHTQWMGDDEEDDDEVVDDEGDDDEEEDAIYGNEDGDEGDVAHVDGEEDREEHADDEDMTTPLTAAVHDRHVQDLLLSNTSTDPRSADRRKSKLDQLEVA